MACERNWTRGRGGALGTEAVQGWALRRGALRVWALSGAVAFAWSGPASGSPWCPEPCVIYSEGHGPSGLSAMGGATQSAQGGSWSDIKKFFKDTLGCQVFGLTCNTPPLTPHEVADIQWDGFHDALAEARQLGPDGNGAPSPFEPVAGEPGVSEVLAGDNCPMCHSEEAWIRQLATAQLDGGLPASSWDWLPGHLHGAAAELHARMQEGWTPSQAVDGQFAWERATDPVDPARGEFSERWVDLFVDSAPEPLSLERCYRSGPLSARVGPLGPGFGLGVYKVVRPWPDPDAAIGADAVGYLIDLGDCDPLVVSQPAAAPDGAPEVDWRWLRPTRPSELRLGVDPEGSGFVIWRQRAQERLVFDEAGLWEHTDRRGLVVATAEWTDSEPRLPTRVTLATGQRLELDSSDGRVVSAALHVPPASVATSAWVEVTYHYDAAGRLKAVQDPDGVVEYYGYAPPEPLVEFSSPGFGAPMLAVEQACVHGCQELTWEENCARFAAGAYDTCIDTVQSACAEAAPAVVDVFESVCKDGAAAAARRGMFKALRDVCAASWVSIHPRLTLVRVLANECAGNLFYHQYHSPLLSAPPQFSNSVSAYLKGVSNQDGWWGPQPAGWIATLTALLDLHEALYEDVRKAVVGDCVLKAKRFTEAVGPLCRAHAWMKCHWWPPDLYATCASDEEAKLSCLDRCLAEGLPRVGDQPSPQFFKTPSARTASLAR